jgi:hypothetical protein
LDLLQFLFGLLRDVQFSGAPLEFYDVLSERPIRGQQADILLEFDMMRRNIPSVPVSLPVKLDIPTIGTKHLANGYFLVNYDARKVVTWMFLHFSEQKCAGEMIASIFESALSEFLNAGSSDKGGAELVDWIGALYNSPISKLNPPLSLILHRERIQAGGDVEIIHP